MGFDVEEEDSVELLLLKLESTEDVHDDLLLLLLSRSTTSPSVVDFYSLLEASLKLADMLVGVLTECFFHAEQLSGAPDGITQTVGDHKASKNDVFEVKAAVSKVAQGIQREAKTYDPDCGEL